MTVSRNHSEGLLDTSTHYQSKYKSQDTYTNSSNTIDLNDWETSIIGSFKKDIITFAEKIKFVNLALQNHFREHDFREHEHLHARNSSAFVNLDESYLPTFLIIIDGYAVPILAAISIVLNLIGIYHLSNGPRRKKLYSIFLSTLFMFDALFVLFQFLKGMDRYVVPISTTKPEMFHLVLNSGIRFSLISSTFMLVAVARIRLSAVKKPFQYNSSMISGEERRKYWMRYVIPIILLSMALTLPLCLKLGNLAHTNEDADSKTGPWLTHLCFTVYVGVLNFGFVGILPIVWLGYLTYNIRAELKKRNKRFSGLRAHRMDKRSNGIKSVSIEQIDNTTRSLQTIIIAFIGLHSFRIIWICGEVYILLSTNKNDANKESGFYLSSWCYVIASLREFFMVINSTVNVIIYLHSDVFKSCRKTPEGNLTP